MKRAIPLFLTVLLLTAILGCNSTSTTSPDPTKIAAAIRLGTSSAVSIGFVAIPDSVEANNDATLALQVLNQNVMPILNGDNAGLLNGLGDLLALNAFNDPKLAKVKMVLEVALPILQNYLPADVAHSAEIPADVKAYLTAFFGGVQDGLNAYLGGGGKSLPAKRDFTTFSDLRLKLSAK